MKRTYSKWQKLRQLFTVLLPICVTQLAIVSTGFFNTVMAGQVSEQDLAGVAAGVNLFYPVFVALLGIVSGLTPTISQLYGADKVKKIPNIVRQAFYWSLLLSLLLLGAGYLFVPSIIELMALEPKVAEVMGGYLVAVSFGIVPVFLTAVLRNFIDAHGMTRLTMLITLVTVPLNIGLNYLLMYGVWGLPALGGVGAGVGSAITWTVGLLLTVTAVCKIGSFDHYHLFRHFPPPDFREWKMQLSLGIPIGATIFCESSIFGLVGLLMSAYGTSIMAAHQAAFNYSSVVYVIPMSISMALAILVGFELGAKRPQDAWQYSNLGRLVSLLAVGVIVALLYTEREMVASLYTRDDDVHELLLVFIVYATAMQYADCINAPLQGTLRGCKDVQATFLMAVVSYWLVGLPVGWLLAHQGEMGPYGYWLGLIVGVLSGAVLLMLRLSMLKKKLSGAT